MERKVLVTPDTPGSLVHNNYNSANIEIEGSLVLVYRCTDYTNGGFYSRGYDYNTGELLYEEFYGGGNLNL